MVYRDTVKRYSFLWSKCLDIDPPEGYHFNSMQEVIPEDIVRGSMGLDLGCGCGWDVYIMAKNNPSVRIVGMDISKGAYAASLLNKDIKNTAIINGSASNIPLKDEICDFVYSFGVLHHMQDYEKGFSEICRVLKKGTPVFLYLYEDHSKTSWKRMAIKLVTFIRRITVRIHPRILYILACLISPVIVLLFSYPARIFKRFKLTYGLYERMPFNFADSLFSLKGDIYDRFAAPIEKRFSEKDLRSIFTGCNFTNVNMTKLKATAGHVVWAYKE